MADDTPKNAIERGMDAYFAGDTVKDLLAAIDIDALAEGAPLDDAVEYEQLGKVLGALLGRAAAKGVSSNGVLGRILKESVGSEVGGRVGKAAVVALVEYGNPRELIDEFRGAVDAERLDQFTENTPESDVNGPAGDPIDEPDWTDIEVEDADE